MAKIFTGYGCWELVRVGVLDGDLIIAPNGTVGIYPICEPGAGSAILRYRANVNGEDTDTTLRNLVAAAENTLKPAPNLDLFKSLGPLTAAVTAAKKVLK